MILGVMDLNTYYGRSHILFGVNLSLRYSEAAFLLGRNGVGKSTTMLSIIGLVKPQSGSIKFQGSEMRGKPAHMISRAGIGYVPEDRRIFSGMTVEENLTVAARSKEGPTAWNVEKIYTLFPILGKRQTQEGTTLSGGEQQMLTVARTLMGNPELLLIDEPTEGLAPLVVNLVCDQLILLKKQGMTMLLADDGISLASKLGDKIYFMEKGLIKWCGTPLEAVAGDESAVKLYLGV